MEQFVLRVSSALAAEHGVVAASDRLPDVGPHTPFGRPIRKYFALSPENKTLNYGSFGNPPIQVVAAQVYHQFVTVDFESDVFFRRKMGRMIDDVRGMLCEYVGLPSEARDDLYLVENAGDAINVATKSIVFSPQFHQFHAERLRGSSNGAAAPPSRASTLNVVMMDKSYPSLLQSCQFWMDMQRAAGGQIGGTTVKMTCIPLTVRMVEDESHLISEFVAAAVAVRADVVFIEHVSFSPAIIMPLREIATRLKQHLPHVVIIVDAAHAIGNIPLQFVPDFSTSSTSASPRLLFDIWFSNCHKWLMAPKTVAVMYVSSELQKFIHPTSVTNNYRGDEWSLRDVEVASIGGNDCAPVERRDTIDDLHVKRQRESYWEGTRDLSSWLCLPQLLKFRCALGEERIMQYNHETCFRGAELVASKWGTTLVIAQRHRLCSLVNVWCPSECKNDRKLVTAIMDTLLDDHHMFASNGQVQGKCFVRLSCQVYNELADFEHFADVFLSVMREKLQQQDSSST